MSIIATETEARSIGGSGTATDRLMCTKTRAEALGCKVAGTYDSNQLVQKADLSKKVTSQIARVTLRYKGTHLSQSSVAAYKGKKWTAILGNALTGPTSGTTTSSDWIINLNNTELTDPLGSYTITLEPPIKVNTKLSVTLNGRTYDVTLKAGSNYIDLSLF